MNQQSKDMNLITKSPTAQIVTMTKDIVDALHAMDTHNRKIQPGPLRLYAEEMKSGNWMVTNQGIGVSSNGVVIDGGHRIQALIDSGYPPAQMLIVTGLHPDSQRYVDTHARRSVKDRIKLAFGVAMNSASAGALKILSAWIRNRGLIDVQFAAMANKQANIDDLEVALSEFEDEFGAIREIEGAGSLRAGVIAAFVVYLKKRPATASEFIKSVISNDGLRMGTPAHTAHRFIFLTPKQYGGTLAAEEFSKVLSCCAYDAKGMPMAKVYGISKWE